MTNLIQYGGAIFDTRCPNCGRFTKPRKQLSVNKFMQIRKRTAPADCKKCGYVRIRFVCFEVKVA